MTAPTHTYGKAALTSTGIGAAALAPVAVTVPYPGDVLFPADSLFPGSTSLPVGLGVATLAPQAIAAAAIQYT